MKSIDYYLNYDHAARFKTTLLCVALGAATGMLMKLLGFSDHVSFGACAVVAVAVEIVRAWTYKQRALKEKV